MVDERARFPAAQLIDNESTNEVWNNLKECLVLMYTGIPSRIHVDQGSNFGPSFVHMAHVQEVHVEKTGIESQYSLGIGERYHYALRQTYRKIFVEYPTADPSLAIAVSVKALNNTIGPEGSVLSALVFGEFPLPYRQTKQKPQRLNVDGRAPIETTARKEMSKIMARKRLRRGLEHEIS